MRTISGGGVEEERVVTIISTLPGGVAIISRIVIIFS